MNNQERLFVVKQAINIRPAFRNFKPMKTFSSSVGPKPPRKHYYPEVPPNFKPDQGILPKMTPLNSLYVPPTLTDKLHLLLYKLKKLPKGWKGSKDDLDFFLNA